MTFLGLEVGSWAEWVSGLSTLAAVLFSLVSAYRANNAKLIFFSGKTKYLKNYVESSENEPVYTNSSPVFVHSKRNSSSKIKLAKFFYKAKGNSEAPIDTYVLTSMSEKDVNGYYNIGSHDYKEILTIDFFELDKMMGISKLNEPKIFLEFEEIKGKRYSLEVNVQDPKRI
ncbi:hypothetical protein LQF60_11735 [Tetragenococcus koreensis]|uniref:hypothetical protein n=1 Tax=Tetragenococcus koreensis TaxID=290335 RepID=UPI000F4EE81C|nr:hypothetical protein [Tetragenococcus koreensis]AYW46477.1 hypothetical protein C7K43_11410 [Tetragenococcus koreensis]MCF1586225.1 hypothetical protein [Tetragenococcus koreensis]MCF1630485.1 hypothetical protein [Tetragenococcus koreensis]GEN92241.1 hypothetical protein TKO01_22870 [Tetragenococcus koreensis]